VACREVEEALVRSDVGLRCTYTSGHLLEASGRRRLDAE
jgi:hypothetical protein